MPDVKLIALDAEDLGVVSANVQDAIVRTADMTFLAKERRFVLVCNRFDALASLLPRAGAAGEEFTRRRAGLRFERVLGAQVAGLDLRDTSRFLVILSATYEPLVGQEPEGYVMLTFAGNAAVRLHVECVEAELRDLGAAWQTEHKPRHEDER